MDTNGQRPARRTPSHCRTQVRKPVLDCDVDSCVALCRLCPRREAACQFPSYLSHSATHGTRESTMRFLFGAHDCGRKTKHAFTVATRCFENRGHHCCCIDRPRVQPLSATPAMPAKLLRKLVAAMASLHILSPPPLASVHVQPGSIESLFFLVRKPHWASPVFAVGLRRSLRPVDRE